MFTYNPRCPFCGANQLSAVNSDKCPGCGRQIAKKHCSICRRDRQFSIDEQLEGCWHCGVVFLATQNEETSLLLESRQATHVVHTVCENCGVKMEEKEIFCKNCGALRKS